MIAAILYYEVEQLGHRIWAIGHEFTQSGTVLFDCNVRELRGLGEIKSPTDQNLPKSHPIPSILLWRGVTK